MQFENTLDFARQKDENDPLAGFRNEFYIPILNGKEVIYFAGGSLGLQPKSVQDKVLDELENWATFGIDGFSMGESPWKESGKALPDFLSPLLGVSSDEIFLNAGPEAQLGQLLKQYHTPDKKIVFQKEAFAANCDLKEVFERSSINVEDLIEIKPREGEMLFRSEDVLDVIKELSGRLSLVVLPYLNPTTGQILFVKSIAKAIRQAGGLSFFDLSDAVGNIRLSLNDMQVDFAGWVTDKYLNSGPGGCTGFFRSSQHHESFWPLAGNPAVMNLAVLSASLEIFGDAGMDRIIQKTENLSSYLLFILNDLITQGGSRPFEIITPFAPSQRGSLIALKAGIKGRHWFDVLKNNGVIAVWQDPDIIKISPAPLYNTYEDGFYFGKILEHAIHVG